MKNEADYNIFDWWKKVVFENYTNFSGRARRKEYWSFQLVNVLFLIPFYIIAIALAATMQNEAMAIVPMGLMVLLLLGVVIPGFAVLVRRLHDTNRSGWYFLIGLIPFIGGLIMLYFYFSEGTHGRNNYGNDPKRPVDELQEIGVTQE